MRTDDPDYTITFDGGARGNPGKGYGSYELRSRSRGEIVRLDFGDRVTNNEAEYRTLIAALRDLIRRITAQGESPDAFALAVRGDSQLVIFQLGGQWKVKTPHIRPLHEEATGLLKPFGAVDLRWHPRANSVRTLGH
jgi:ribonuclease HI